MILVALALAGAPAAEAGAAAPPGLSFGFIRMAVFRQRARELGCRAGDLDGELEAIRKRLAARFGKKAFAYPKVPHSGPGDCFTALSIYRVNLGTFRREAEAALGASK
jgi:hypothetical protein